MIEHAFSARPLPERTSCSDKLSRFLPRFIRLRDAPSYLGMDKNRFNRDGFEARLGGRDFEAPKVTGQPRAATCGEARQTDGQPPLAW